jgi:mRNA interferase RelE/StbE
VKSLRIDIPTHVADIFHSLHPDLERSLKAALRAIASDPHCGEPLLRELEGLQKYRVRRFRIVYRVDRKAKVIQVMTIGPRRHIYEELAERLHRGRRE